ncbi:tetraspanin-13-like isoform X2 [Portunus trituberculatus]|uniref:tetraspanin-13-like isoform X2 n=1 Tax=Portunus trituberculatus TaxID=210409 RepID=UPI001E1D02C2|nr:tetraspanin-13-like isoform X2 [Portunus trituberculatus]
MCGGFTCSKNSLLALNILYIIVAFIMIGVAAGANMSSIVTSLSLVSAIIACAVFLLFISIVGLIGASKHHQVMLFFYMIVLFIIFIIQFSVACACLAINEDQERLVAANGWLEGGLPIQADAQNWFRCCGYNNSDLGLTQGGDHPSCKDIPSCCPNVTEESMCCRSPNDCHCVSCDIPIKQVMLRGFQLVGGIGLFFSFTEFLGVWLTVRYRNQRDPRANPSAFL